MHTQKSNVPVPPSTGVNSCTDASGSQPRSLLLKVVLIVLCIWDSGASKNYDGDRSRLMIFHEKGLSGQLDSGMDHLWCYYGYGDYVMQIQVGINKTVRFICTDNGTEFVNKTLYDYYESVGIFHQKTVPRTPQQNGVAERQNRTLVEAARTMLIFSKAPIFLWAERRILGKLRTKGLILESSMGYARAEIRGNRSLPTVDAWEPISSGLVPNPAPVLPYVPPTNKELEMNPFSPVSNRKSVCFFFILRMLCGASTIRLSKSNHKLSNLLQLLKTAGFKPCKKKSMNLIDWTYWEFSNPFLSSAMIIALN
ncbi:retrovirus-related pol polyprotein from transposon TNT 1-94 [Tanacetum coccineum]